jgi:D-mycarose 3-C-methyltransferase
MGDMPLANSFTVDGVCKKYPLEVVYCENCSLLQIANDIDPIQLFSHYPYHSSASKPLADHFENVAHAIEDVMQPNDLICEIGCNDGVFLQHFNDKLIRTVGVEPAINFEKDLTDKNVPFVQSFFDHDTAINIVDKHGKAKVIFAANVVAHVMDLHQLMLGVKRLLTDDGMFILEVHALSNLLEHCCYDQIYHEHRCYFSLKSIKYLLEMYGFEIVDVKQFPIHGLSTRVICQRLIAPCSVDFNDVELLLNTESKHIDGRNIDKFSSNIRHHAHLLKKLIYDLKLEGRSIAGYGAPAKCNTLLNYLDLDSNTIDYIIDSTPDKQGMKTPHTKIPIYDRSHLIENRPDYLIMFCWNYADYVIEKEREIIKEGTSFLIPFPNIHIR